MSDVKTQSLDRVVILGQIQEVKNAVEDLRKALNELKERTVKLEANVAVQETGLNMIAHALELHGILKDGEAVSPPKTADVSVDSSKLFWEKRKGEKGEYEQTSEKANQNSDLWKTLQAKVKEHKGFWQNGGFKFWFHQQDETVIDRRKV